MLQVGTSASSIGLSVHLRVMEENWLIVVGMVSNLEALASSLIAMAYDYVIM